MAHLDVLSTRPVLPPHNERRIPPSPLASESPRPRLERRRSINQCCIVWLAIRELLPFLMQTHAPDKKKTRSQTRRRTSQREDTVSARLSRPTETDGAPLQWCRARQDQWKRQQPANCNHSLSGADANNFSQENREYASHEPSNDTSSKNTDQNQNSRLEMSGTTPGTTSPGMECGSDPRNICRVQAPTTSGKKKELNLRMCVACGVVGQFSGTS